MNFQKFLFFVAFFVIKIGAQQFDESFIQSLPADLQIDFLEQSENSSKDDKNYPNPESRILKLEAALEDAEASLAKIRNDMLDSDASKDDSDLKRIGDNFFQSYQSTFLPINEPNLDGNYLLDVGDELTLQLIGKNKKPEKIRIKRDGTINIPELGELAVAGLTLNNAAEIIRDVVDETFIGVKAFISLSSLRDINVLVIGNVFRPGMYTLSGGSSPMSLLYAAGGIDINGSFRSITHKRQNEVLQNIDLYEVLLKGNLNFNHQLRSGDVIIVNPKLKEVRVSGSFANPGIYELLPNENLETLLRFASPFGFQTNQNLNIERFAQSGIQNIEVRISEADSLALSDGDNITFLGVTPKFNQTNLITITGEVKAPGVYALPDNARLSDLINKAQGYTENAYPTAGILNRLSVKDLEIEAKEKSYNELIRYLVASPQFAQVLTTPNSESILTFLQLLKGFEPSGRLITEFSMSKLRKNPNLDRLLQQGDKIHIPAFSPDVFIFGEVMNPGAVPYNEMNSAIDYLSQAGGISRVADSERILIVSPAGEVKIVKKTFFNILDQNGYILPGSTIYVPREVGRLDGINLASSVAPIISSFALSLASLNSINN